VQGYGKNRFCHHVADRLVGECSGVVLDGRGCAVAETAILAPRFGDTGEDAGDKKCRWIKGIVKSDLEFLTSSEGFDVGAVLLCAVVGKNPEDVVLAGLFALGGLVGLRPRGLRRVRQRLLLGKYRPAAMKSSSR
jgi:hypothetical protein